MRLAAQARSDELEERRLHDTAPVFQSPTLPHLQTEMALHTMTLLYVAEQLESAASHFFAQMQMREGKVKDDLMIADLAGLACTHAYFFHVRAQAWLEFCGSVGVDPAALVQANHEGMMLRFFEDQMVKFVPTQEELTDWFRGRREEPGPLISVESEYRSWRHLLEKATSDPPCFH